MTMTVEIEPRVWRNADVEELEKRISVAADTATSVQTTEAALAELRAAVAQEVSDLVELSRREDSDTVAYCAMAAIERLNVLLPSEMQTKCN